MNLKASLLSVCLVMCACGAAADRDKFLGAWTFKPTDYAVTCPTGVSMVRLSGTLNVKADTGASGITVLDGKSCNFAYDVKGNAASASKRTCSWPEPSLGQGVTANATYDTITLLTADGASMTDTFVGTVAFTSSAGTLDCTFNGTATLER
jgi:hypothetical protein